MLVPQTILKVDHWSSEMVTKSIIKGAPNFRHIPNTNIFAVAQPTLNGMRNVLLAVRTALPADHELENLVWINLREEPLVYINGSPYVLRDQYYTLRNIKAYSGITENRLELLENRLKEDVAKELSTYEGRILLHEETSEGIVQAVWTPVPAEYVHTMKDIVGILQDGEGGDILHYFRIPLTAEAAPEENDFDQLIQIIGRYEIKKSAFVL